MEDLLPTAWQEIDGWFELRFPQNLQGTNVERYAMHIAAWMHVSRWEPLGAAGSRCDAGLVG